MPLTPEEEKRYREEIRKRLEERLRKEEDFKKRQEEERQQLLEERLRAQIREEETERYFTEKGFVKYINRHGEVEWLSPEEAEKRGGRRRGKKKSGSSRKSQKAKQKSFFLNVSLVIILMAALYGAYLWNPFSAPKTGRLLVASDVPGAEIYLDGKQTGLITPDTLENVSLGRHLVAVYKEGYSVFPPVVDVGVSTKMVASASFKLQSALQLVPVTIHSNVSGFNLYVDGIKRLGVKGNKIELSPGYHTIMITKKGYLATPAYRRVLVLPENPPELKFELVPSEEIGYLQISNNEFRGYVYLDREFTGVQATGDVIPVKAGTYEVRVRENGFVCRPDSILVNVLPGEKKMVTFRLEPETAMVEVDFLTPEPGAAIFIDGFWQPVVTPVTKMQLTAGKHFVNLAREDKFLYKRDEAVFLNPESEEPYRFYYRF